jgi:Helix-turn-helix domain
MKKPKAITPADLLTLDETQTELKCSRRRVYLLAKAGRLHLVKFGANTRVTRASIDALVAQIASTPWVPAVGKKESA